MKGKDQIKARFAGALKKVMKVKNISLHKLADEAGLEYAHVQKIASGKVNVELTTIIAIAEGLEISPGELFNYF